jgi:1-deoxy-D-xylulose-5-phosphate reductoisomerase
LKSVVILGATGSIGTQAVEFLRRHRDKFDLVGISVGSNWIGAASIAAEFNCKQIAVKDISAAQELRTANSGIEVIDGDRAAAILAGSGADIVLAAISGSVGLSSVVSAIRAGSQLALANKESLVCAGPALLELARKHAARLIPVDSEHSALFQCMLGGTHSEVASLVLTASGGPFRFASYEELERATPDQALAHPNWAMGAKNSLDSATLANKGLELIEACFLFQVEEQQVEVIVNPSSLFHGAVQFVDGCMIAQLGHTDMRAPIGYALSWPDRYPSGVGPISLSDLKKLEFWEPDNDRFPSLKLARLAARGGQAATLLFNAANEVAGQAFLRGQIGFMDIPAVIEKCLADGGMTFSATIDDVVTADRAAKLFCQDRVGTWLARAVAR